VERLEYKGWPNCYRLSNEVIDLVVTADVGPRIIRFGFAGQDNEFKEFAETLGQTGGDEWHIYGGYRLWHAPESLPRTYFPDNEPVQVQQHDHFVRIVQHTEPTTSIQKEIDIWISPNEAHVSVTGRLRNTNLWAVELAPWSLSVMAQGGVAILPLPPRGSHAENLQPKSTFTLWAYTDMADPRWTWGNRYVLLRQDPDMEAPQKIGASVPDGWAAYARDGHLYVKTFDYVPGAKYPDLGCSAELFTNADFLEAESLAPLVCLKPGESVEHVEHWFLFHGVPAPESDTDVENHVLARVQAAKTWAARTRSAQDR
jgi:hypothetical protein